MRFLHNAPPRCPASRPPCSHCNFPGIALFDRVGDVVVCPDCQALAVRGELSPALALSLNVGRACLFCNQTGTIPFVTWPLHGERALEFDLCPDHLRALLGRRLEPDQLRQVHRHLYSIGLQPRQVFLLCEAFYDEATGKALLPVPEQVADAEQGEGV